LTSEPNYTNNKVESLDIIFQETYATLDKSRNLHSIRQQSSQKCKGTLFCYFIKQLVCNKNL